MQGTAQQYGEADIKGRDFSGQSLQRSNFTSADWWVVGWVGGSLPRGLPARRTLTLPPTPLVCSRDCNFAHSKLQGAYFIKAVVPRANFEGADLSDVLMDRAVMVEVGDMRARSSWLTPAVAAAHSEGM